MRISYTAIAVAAVALAATRGAAQESADSASAQEADEAERLDPDIAAANEADTLSLPASGWAALLPDCARPDSNYISLPGGVSREMSILVDKLDSVLLFGHGRVSIVHIGGSHVQADMYTDEIRIRIDSLNNGLRPPRGFLFPYRVAKTNNPQGYRVSSGGKWDKARCSVRKPRPALGVNGIAVWTSDPEAWISFDLDPKMTGRWQTSRVKILGRSDVGRKGSRLTPVIRACGADTRAESHDPSTMTYTFSLPQATTNFTLRFEREKAEADTAMAAEAALPTFYVDGFIADNDEDGITYHTIGVNGAAVPHYLRCERFESEMGALKPDLVIMAIGINDASGPNFSPENFKDNYDQLIRLFRRVNPDCAFIFITNNDSKRRAGRRRRVVNRNGPLAEDAFAQIATKWQGGLWNLFEVMGGLGSMAQWQKAGLAGRDNIHFTRLGYKVVGALFYDAFLNFYLDQDAECAAGETLDHQAD